MFLRLLVLALSTHAAFAQARAIELSGPRQTAGLFFHTDFNLEGAFSIHYAQPEWKPEYDALFGGSDGAQVFRLGKDLWTTLDTSVELMLGGTLLAAGDYYLGLHRAVDGQWSLAVFDPAEIRRLQVSPAQTAELEPAFLAALEHATNESSEPQLTLTAAADPETVGRGTLTIRWGAHRLTTPVQARLVSSDPDKQLRSTLGWMAALLEQAEHEQLITLFMTPDDLQSATAASGSVEALVERFAQSGKAEQLLEIVRAARSMTPGYDAEKGVATFKNDSFPRPLRFVRIGKKWYLKN